MLQSLRMMTPTALIRSLAQIRAQIRNAQKRDLILISALTRTLIIVQIRALIRALKRVLATQKVQKIAVLNQSLNARRKRAIKIKPAKNQCVPLSVQINVLQRSLSALHHRKAVLHQISAHLKNHQISVNQASKILVISVQINQRNARARKTLIV